MTAGSIKDYLYDFKEKLAYLNLHKFLAHLLDLNDTLTIILGCKGYILRERQMKKLLFAILMGVAFLTSFNVHAEENMMTDKKILVAYFSATGTTAGVAERLAKATGGDLFEIKPAQPYTNADLDWRNKESRSSVEMKDMSSRPEIAAKVDDMSQYNVIFVGFPIWWYREPSIIDTFMESYDFNGKTIIPFATSGGSGMGDSAEIMQQLAPQARVLEGQRFQSNVSEDELKQWADKLL